jgi:UPF0176 protein
MTPTLNIAAYKFTSLDDLSKRQKTLSQRCHELDLKGTILLSAEGLNMFLAGDPRAITTLLAEVRQEDIFKDLEVKESHSDRQPFTRMLVKIKKEIIAFGIDGIDPVGKPSARVEAKELKEWLDQGRDITLLDVRNDYEVDVGTFENARAIGLDHFRKFPEAVALLPEKLKEKPIVMFCTGGVRCEKAGPFMERQGFKEVYQLNGGILKYFEDCGGQHYQGDCFVFDQRVALDPNLDESPVAQCYACLTPLSVEQQQSEFYVAGQSCPHCYQRPAQKMQTMLARRQEQLSRLVDPLPGSAPYDNRRPINVSQRFDQQSLGQLLECVFPHKARQEWLDLIAQGRLLDAHDEAASLDQIVRGGQQYFHLTPGTVEPAVNADIAILYEDRDLVIVNKPAPLPMHPCGRFNRNSLTHILNQIYAPMRLRPAHRLDANTSGLVVFSRSKKVAGKIQQQFEKHQVRKLYIAQIQGSPDSDQFICQAKISADPGPAGLRTIDECGLEARTDFEVLGRYDDGTSLVQATLRTGRTNQIRLHLWHLGWPVLGDQSYLPERQTAGTQTASLTAEPLHLHALRLTFQHPMKDQEMNMRGLTPAWARQLPQLNLDQERND